MDQSPLDHVVPQGTVAGAAMTRRVRLPASHELWQNKSTIAESRAAVSSWRLLRFIAPVVLFVFVAVAGCSGEASRDDGGLVRAGAAVKSDAGLKADKGATLEQRPSTAEEALAAMKAGNRRFVSGRSQHPHESANYRASLADEQHPFATVLACSDSRVTPVLIFDQGIGDLFVIRVAGNVVDEDVAGSIEYAVDHLGVKLLVVMGHENCGAVTAAFHAFVARDLEGREPREIEALLRRVEPALKQLDRSAPQSDQIAQGVELNVRAAVQQLSAIADLRQAQERRDLEIVGAIYSLSTGEVRFLDP